MEQLIKAAVLGLIQGLTEFLPVSSSGHLVIFSELLNFQQKGIAFDVFVHFGTLLSILVFFRKDLAAMFAAPVQVWLQKKDDPQMRHYLNWDLYIIVATIPAVIVGLFFKDAIENLFTSTLFVFFMLLITGSLMFFAQNLKFRNTNFNYGNSFLIGIAQAVAIIPGISRSGSTIFTGMALGIERESVARFSFLMSVPAILGAVVLEMKDLLQAPPTSAEMLDLIVGALVAFVSGYVAILWLLDMVKKGKLRWFGYYCFALAFAGLIWYWV